MKISKTHHRTKQGVVKRNPKKKKMTLDNAIDLIEKDGNYIVDDQFFDDYTEREIIEIGKDIKEGRR